MDDNDLKAWYLNGLAGKSETLEALAAKASLTPAEEEELRRMAHQLAGSGKSYGYPAISTAAQALEDALPADRNPRLAELIGVLAAALEDPVNPVPAAPVKAPPESEPHYARSLFPDGASVLLAEDDIYVAAIIKRKLASRGMRVDHYPDGKAAQDAAFAKAYDLIILDVDLPGMDGFSVLAGMRAESSLKKVPVMMLTGKRQGKDVKTGLELGANDYLIKPFLPFEVLKRAEKLLAANR